LVGVVGDDFPEEHIGFFRDRQIDLEGLQRAAGKTFRWSGEYHWDLNTRETRSVDLNVFEHFSPELPPAYRQSEMVLLANIAPKLQSQVLDQMDKPRFVIADTMDLWINIANEDLRALLPRVDLLVLSMWRSRKANTAASSSGKALSSVAARILWRTSMIPRARATPSSGRWQDICRHFREALALPSCGGPWCTEAWWPVTTWRLSVSEGCAV
ncbi:MAG: hypothetical protein RLZZ253_3239, partial [Verrucomicrobiota bacterium]